MCFCLSQLFLDLQLIREEHYAASLVHTHDTDLRATMNMAVGNGVIAAGQDGTCCVMKYKRSKRAEETTAAGKEGEDLKVKYLHSHQSIF